MLKLTKRSRTWYIRGTLRGRSIYKSTKTSDRQIAEAIKIQTESEILHRSVFGDKGESFFSEAIALYLTAGGEKRFLDRILERLGRDKLKNITGAVAHNVANELYPEAKPATKNRQCITPIRSVMNFAADAGLCHLVRIRNFTVEDKERPHATPEYFEALFPHCAPNLKAICLFMFKTSRRVGDAIKIEKHHRIGWDYYLDLQRGVAYIGRTKNGDPVIVHLPTDVVAAIANLPDYPNGRVFGYSDIRSVNNALSRAAKRAGVKYLSSHEVGRHAFGFAYMKYASANLKELMAAGDWKSLSSVKRYMHTDPGAAKKKTDLIPEIGAKSVQKKKRA